MRTIAITNQKGGSGKTTTAVNLAATLAETGRRVLLIDMDPQGNASAWLGVEDAGANLLEVLIQNREIGTVVRNGSVSSLPSLSIVPASPDLARAELDLAAMKTGADRVLRRRLRSMNGEYDYILIDTPPTLGFLTVNALMAADSVLIPVEVGVMAIAGLVRLLDTLQEVRESGEHPISIAGILPCRVDARTLNAREVLEFLSAEYSHLLRRTQIRETVRLRESPALRAPITVTAPESSGAADYRALAIEIIEQEEGITA